MRTLEVGYELADDLALAAHGPESDNRRRVRRILAAGKSPRNDKNEDNAHCSPIDTRTVDQCIAGSLRCT